MAEDSIDGLIALLEKLRKFEDSGAYVAFKDNTHATSNGYFDKNKGEDGNLHLDSSKARGLADTLWGSNVDVIATKYLNLDPEKRKALEAQDPAEKKSFLEKEVESQWGITKQALYDSLNARGTVTREEFAQIISQLPQQYLSVVRGKMMSVEINDINKASKYNQHLTILKDKDPQTFKNVGIAKDPTNVDAVRSTIGAAVGALPSNYGIVLGQYKEKAVYK